MSCVYKNYYAYAVTAVTVATVACIAFGGFCPFGRCPVKGKGGCFHGKCCPKGLCCGKFDAKEKDEKFLLEWLKSKQATVPENATKEQLVELVESLQ